MALSVLDGNQSATTLSSVVTGGEHIVAHSVVSLGSNAISNIATAVSGTTVCVGSISISGTPSVTGSVSVLNFPASQSVTFGATTGSVSILNLPSTQTVTFGLISGTVTANNSTLTNVLQYDGSHYFLKVGGVATTGGTSFPVYVAGTVTANPTGTQTIAGTVTATLGAGTQKIGSVTAFGRRTNYTDGIEIPIGIQGDTGLGYGYNDNPFIPIRIITNQTAQSLDFVGNDTGGKLPISGTVTIGNSVTVGNSVTIGSLPAISGTVTANVGQILVRDDGTGAVTSGYLPVGNSSWSGQSGAVVVMGGADDGAVPAHLTSIFGLTFPISGTVTANTFALQGTAVTTSNFTSTTASTLLAGYNATREVLTIFNEGAGNLHLCVGATCTTIAYQVRLSAGDYYEVPNHQTTITHSAVFATAGTARVTEVS